MILHMSSSLPILSAATTAVAMAISPAQEAESTTSVPNNLGCESLRMPIKLTQYLLSDPADEVFIASLVIISPITVIFSFKGGVKFHQGAVKLTRLISFSCVGLLLSSSSPPPLLLFLLVFLLSVCLSFCGPYPPPKLISKLTG